MTTVKIDNISTLILCTASHMMSHIHLFVLPALMPLFKNLYHLSYSEIALILSVYFLLLAISTPISSVLAERYSIKIMIVVGMILAGMALFLLSFVNTLQNKIIVSGILGAGSAIYHPCGTTLLSNLYDQSVRGKVMGIHGVGSNLGVIVAPIILGICIKFNAYKLAMYLFAAMSITIGIFDYFMLNNTVMSDGLKIKKKFVMLSMLKSKRNVFAYLAYGLRDATYCGLFIFVPLYLVNHYDYSAAFAASVLGILPIIGIGANVVGGVLGDSIGRLETIIIGLAVACGGFICVVYGGVHVYLFFLVMIFIAIGLFATFPLFDAVVADITPIEFRTFQYGNIFSLGAVLGGIIALMGGVISDLISPNIAFSILGIASFLCLLFIWLLKKEASRLDHDIL